MTSIIITETQLVKLVETAMDLDIYVQPIDQPFSNGNQDLEDTLSEIIDKAKELRSMLETGKKTYYDSKSELYKVLDDFNKVYDSIKFGD